MRYLTFHLLPRWLWFRLWFSENLNSNFGIFNFWHDALSWAMQRAIRSTRRMNRKNRKLFKEIEALITEKSNLLEGENQIGPEEWAGIKTRLRRQASVIAFCVALESAFNYPGVQVFLNQSGAFMYMARFSAAIAITWLGVYIFKKWFLVLLNRTPRGVEPPKKRDWLEFGLLTAICIAYEFAIYFLCHVRDEAFAGKIDNPMLKNFLIVLGLLVPIITGYVECERSLLLSAYSATKEIEEIEDKINKKAKTIVQNWRKIETRLAGLITFHWRMVNSFHIFKTNWDKKKERDEESFTKTYAEFDGEIRKRYFDEAIALDFMRKDAIYGASQNGRATSREEAALIAHITKTNRT